MTLRFCMVTTFYPPYNFGGDGLFVQQLATELARRGHGVEVIHCADSYRFLAGDEPEPGFPDHPNVNVHRLRSAVGFLSPLATHQTGLPLFKSTRIREVLSRGFDVIHFHNASLVGGPGLLAYGSAIKLYTLHEYWLVCPTHLLFKYDRKPCTRPRCFACTLVHGRPPQLWRWSAMLRRAVEHVDLFFAPSRFVADKHREMGLDLPIVELPYFSARWGDDSQDPLASPDQTPYFLFVGRLERSKGLQTLIPLFRDHRKARLLVAGTGRYEPELREMATGANVTFLGFQSEERLRSLYARAVALIVPSLWYEVFAIVILEAFSQRTPAIVRNIGGMPQIIEESGGGFVYETEAELVTAMDRLLADPELRTTSGLRGYRAFQQRWCAEAYVERYLALIEQVAAGRRSLESGETLSGS